MFLHVDIRNNRKCVLLLLIVEIYYFHLLF